MITLVLTLAGFAEKLALAVVWPLPHLLISLAALTGYVLLAAVKPDKTCRRCKGWGTSHKRRRPSCKRCGGTGTRFRPGASLVHRGISLAARHMRERRNSQ